MTTQTYPRVVRAVAVTCCPVCKGVSGRLFAVAGWHRARCWGCLLVLVGALNAAREDEREYQYDRFNNDSRGGY